MAEEKVKSKYHYMMKVDQQRDGSNGKPAGTTRARRECSLLSSHPRRFTRSWLPLPRWQVDCLRSV